MSLLQLLQDPAWTALTAKIEEKIAAQFKTIDDTVVYNQAKVLQAFQEEKVADFHFASSTGYGHNDAGRETLEQVYAKAFGADQADPDGRRLHDDGWRRDAAFTSGWVGDGN